MVGSPPRASGASADADDAGTKTAIAARFRALRSVKVRYSEKLDYTPSARQKAILAERGKAPYEGTFAAICGFWFLDGRSRFERTLSPETLKWASSQGWNEPAHSLTSFSHERVEQMSEFPVFKRPEGQIANSTDLPLPDFVVVDTALGLRGDGQPVWLDDALLETGNVVAAKTASRTLEFRIARASGLVDSWYFEIVDKSIRIARYTLTGLAGEPCTEIVCQDFHLIAGQSLPSKITGKRFSREPVEPWATETRTISVDDYQLDDPTNTQTSYTTVWPLGSEVYDRRTRERFVVSSAPRTIDDETISHTLELKLKATQERMEKINAISKSPATRP